MSDTFHPGELFVYTNGNRWELGMVKRPNNTGDGYFCWYSRGDTAANTPTCHMHKLANAGFTHIEQLLDNAIPTATRISVPHEGHTAIGHYECGDCRCVVGAQDAYCKHCGVKLVEP